MATLGALLFSTYSSYRGSFVGGAYVRHSHPLPGRGGWRSDRAQHRDNRFQVVAKHGVSIAVPSMPKSASVETERCLGRKSTSPGWAIDRPTVKRSLSIAVSAQQTRGTMLKSIPWHVWAGAAVATAAVFVTAFDPSPLLFIAAFIALCATSSST
jgi:hypothetical protein